MRRTILLGLIGLGLIGTLTYADYNRGFKYYNKYIKKTTHLSSTKFLKELNITNKAQLDALMNEENLTKALTKMGVKENKIKKIIKKREDIKDFLKGIMEGKVPAGC